MSDRDIDESEDHEAYEADIEDALIEVNDIINDDVFILNQQAKLQHIGQMQKKAKSIKHTTENAIEYGAEVVSAMN